MGVRQSATIVFAENLPRRGEKRLKEIENGKDSGGGQWGQFFKKIKTFLHRYRLKPVHES
jgi:hypothetical protein